MWYITSQNKTKCLEEKILEGNAENAVRRRLFMTGDYNPDEQKIASLVKRTMKKILEEYGDYNLVRHHVKNESLTSIVDSVLDSIFKSPKRHK
jgi:hypothetical protein